MRSRLFLSFACLVAAVAASGAKRAFTIDDQYRLRGVETPSVAPDGSVVFGLRSSDLAKAQQVTHLWMTDGRGGKPRQLTFSEKGESSPVFSRDGKSILFASSRDGDPNLYILPAGGGEARKLTKIATGAGDQLWSPDGKWVAFSSDVYPECGADDACNKKIGERWTKGRLQAHMADSLLYRHWTDWKDGKRSHILLAEVATGKVRDLTAG